MDAGDVGERNNSFSISASVRVQRSKTSRRSLGNRRVTNWRNSLVRSNGGSSTGGDLVDSFTKALSGKVATPLTVSQTILSLSSSNLACDNLRAKTAPTITAGNSPLSLPANAAASEPSCDAPSSTAEKN